MSSLILVPEDDPAIAHRLMTLCRHAGHAVVVARDGAYPDLHDNPKPFSSREPVPCIMRFLPLPGTAPAYGKEACHG